MAWFRKAAEQGIPIAQFKLGVAYENGQGVAKDDVLAYANYAHRGAQRIQGGRRRTATRSREAYRRANARGAVAGRCLGGRRAEPVANRGGVRSRDDPAAAARPCTDKCSASGRWSGEKFSAAHCAVALYGDQHSVAIWFNEDAYRAPRSGGLPALLLRRLTAQGRQAADDGARSCSARAGARRPPRRRGQVDRLQHKSRQVAARRRAMGRSKRRPTSRSRR